MVRQVVLSSGEHSVTLTRETRRRADEALAALSQAATRAIDPTTGEVLAPATRTLLTTGDADSPYPWPSEARFEDGDVVEFVDAPDLEAIAGAIIEARPSLRWLEKRTLTYLWKRAGGNDAGKARFGACVKPTGLARYWGKSDFVIWLALDHCRNAFLTRWQVEALLTHELLHCDETEKGAPALKPHDFAGFTAELAWYGPWQSDLQRMVKVARQLPLFESDEVSE